MSFDQGEFNFNAKGSGDGYRKWREELDARKRAFESLWGVVLGKPVTVSLRHHAKPLSERLGQSGPKDTSTSACAAWSSATRKSKASCRRIRSRFAPRHADSYRAAQP